MRDDQVVSAARVETDPVFVAGCFSSFSWSFSEARGDVFEVDGVEVYADDWPLLRRLLTRRYWACRVWPFVERRIQRRIQDASLLFLRLQGQDVSAATVLDLVRACGEARCDGDATWGYHGGRPGYGEGEDDPPVSHWANRWDLGKALGNPPERALLARLRRMVDAGELSGCACGCRGDFELPEARRGSLGLLGDASPTP